MMILVFRREACQDPFFFLIYINDLVQCINLHLSVFADDIFIYTSKGDSKNRAKLINSDLNNVGNWSYKWRIVFDGPKFKCINFCNSIDNDNPCCNFFLKLDDVLMEKIIGDMINPSINDEYKYYMENDTSSVSPVTALTIANFSLFNKLNKCVNMLKMGDSNCVTQSGDSRENKQKARKQKNVYKLDIKLKSVINDMINPDYVNEYNFYAKNGTCKVSPVTQQAIANFKLFNVIKKCDVMKP